MGVLESAEAWGCPPWEIKPGDSRFLWHIRRQEYQREVVKGTKERQKQRGKKK